MLSTLVERAPGARGAVLCDHEGEFVELVVRDPGLSAYDMRVFGAQIAAAWLNVGTRATEHGAGGIVELRLTCAGGTLLCRSLRDGYYALLLVERGVPSAAAAFELQATVSQLADEL
jgi:hypothetical protein